MIANMSPITREDLIVLQTKSGFYDIKPTVFHDTGAPKTRLRKALQKISQIRLSDQQNNGGEVDILNLGHSK